MDNKHPENVYLRWSLRMHISGEVTSQSSPRKHEARYQSTERQHLRSGCRWYFNLQAQMLTAASSSDDDGDQSRNPGISLIPMQDFKSTERYEQCQTRDDDDANSSINRRTVCHSRQCLTTDDRVNHTESSQGRQVQQD